MAASPLTLRLAAFGLLRDNGRGNVEAMASGTFSGGTVIGGGLIAARSSVEFDPASALALSLRQRRQWRQ
jgi:hypothetical protein